MSLQQILPLFVHALLLACGVRHRILNRSMRFVYTTTAGKHDAVEETENTWQRDDEMRRRRQARETTSAVTVTQILWLIKNANTSLFLSEVKTPMKGSVLEDFLWNFLFFIMCSKYFPIMIMQLEAARWRSG